MWANCHQWNPPGIPCGWGMCAWCIGPCTLSRIRSVPQAKWTTWTVDPDWPAPGQQPIAQHRHLVGWQPLSQWVWAQQSPWLNKGKNTQCIIPAEKAEYQPQRIKLTGLDLRHRLSSQRNWLQVEGSLGGLQRVLMQSSLQTNNADLQTCKGDPKLTRMNTGKRDQCVLTVEDVGRIESLLALVQNVQIEGGSVPDFIVSVQLYSLE